MWNAVALFFVSVFGIVVLDEDPTAVSPQEWAFFGVMIYAALRFFNIYRDLVSRHERQGPP